MFMSEKVKEFWMSLNGVVFLLAICAIIWLGSPYSYPVLGIFPGRAVFESLFYIGLVFAACAFLTFIVKHNSVYHMPYAVFLAAYDILLTVTAAFIYFTRGRFAAWSFHALDGTTKWCFVIYFIWAAFDCAIDAICRCRLGRKNQ